MGQPWMKFFPTDWRADPALRMCSLAARGLWMELLCVMHEATPCGSLVVNGRALTLRQIAALGGTSVEEAQSLLEEMEQAGVFSRDEDGTVFSRRMRRDVAKATQDRLNGKEGGNPSLRVVPKPVVNPPVDAKHNGHDKAHMPEARDQIPERSADICVSETASEEKETQKLFDEVWEGFPKDQTASRGQADAAFALLSMDEKRNFASNIGMIASHIAKMKLPIPYSLAKFIGAKKFEGFLSENKPPTIKTTFVEVDTPEWKSRVAAGHRAGLKTQERVDGKVLEGWRFPVVAAASA